MPSIVRVTALIGIDLIVGSAAKPRVNCFVDRMVLRAIAFVVTTISQLFLRIIVGTTNCELVYSMARMM